MWKNHLAISIIPFRTGKKVSQSTKVDVPTKCYNLRIAKSSRFPCFVCSHTPSNNQKFWNFEILEEKVEMRMAERYKVQTLSWSQHHTSWKSELERAMFSIMKRIKFGQFWQVESLLAWPTKWNWIVSQMAKGRYGYLVLRVSFECKKENNNDNNLPKRQDESCGI